MPLGVLQRGVRKLRCPIIIITEYFGKVELNLSQLNAIFSKITSFMMIEIIYLIILRFIPP